MYQHNNRHKEERHDHEPRVKRDYIGTASKGEGARENKKYFSEQERDEASSHKIGARASLAEKPLWTKTGPNLQSSG